jgi:RNA polymerase sigma-70 factor (ECF subfamily)
MRDDPFVTHRSLLFTVAYEMLGSAADAEDVVQETWLRWADVEFAEVRDPRAYLVRIVTRQALNRLRTLARRREEYVGEWLPEPLPTSPDVAEDVELAESVSIAMLTVLETLAPTERAVFVLREVFEVPYADIAAAVDKTPGAVRQIAHRAREHVAARRPRIEVDRGEHQQVVDRFLAALQTGDLQVLLDVLAPEVVLVADGGGEAAAFRRPVVGSDRVATLLSRFPTILPDAVVGTVWLNGGGADHPHLRDAQPAQARPAGRRGHAQPLSGVAADPAGSGAAYPVPVCECHVAISGSERGRNPRMRTSPIRSSQKFATCKQRLSNTKTRH